MSEREKIAARIRALKAKTVENGCTEAEAMAAAALLADLLAKYNMTLDEADLRASPFERHQEHHADEVGERLWKVADGVQVLTGARYWTSRPGVWPIEISFFGLSHEVEVARYLLEICAGAMRRERARIVAEAWPRSVRRRQILPFLDGMADRLRKRLIEMKPPEPRGTGLMVLKGALVEQAMREAGLKTEQRSARSSRDWEASYQDGRAAAEGVALNPGLSSGRTQGLLT